MDAYADLLKKLGVESAKGDLESFSPIDGALIGKAQINKAGDVEGMAEKAASAFKAWRKVPAPVRGEFVRLLGEELRAVKEDLGLLVTLECGKSKTEGLGEVQEMIDICDYAVGLSRQLYGLTISSERPQHHMHEAWHPIGPVGIISAFNFPVAVWSWNAAIALVCGNSIVWKPSEKTPLSALACQVLFDKAAAKFKAAGYEIPDHLSQVLVGERDVGEAMVEHAGFPLISATGSTRMGRAVGQAVAARFGRSILELGGNNAIIVAPSADQDLALVGVAFGAVGTAGQRCTTTRRLFVHESIYDEFISKLVNGYGQLKIGDPKNSENHIGPLIDKDAVQGFESAVAQAKEQGGNILVGGERQGAGVPEGGFYVQPTIVEMEEQTDIVCHETFAPIIYVMKYSKLEEAIEMQNAVPQGLSSAIFTTDVREAEFFKSASGSDCGIANVNIGTSGAEIGGAFGGEKETGGGRESGSDAWKAYMRRQTQTTNYGSALPLAQGVKFNF
ncbi:MAG: aldehyde dehydrogenase family protein [Alphaproteobacteria bacterium]|nr:aldehyde dehydrogenase family protein [Alphaproteobacteria bacterium]